ncbi:hypothetical protein GCM10010232_67980 [Streptomyces amakusaensis]
MAGTVHATTNNYLVSPVLYIVNRHVKALAELVRDPARRGGDADAVTRTQGARISN